MIVRISLKPTILTIRWNSKQKEDLQMNIFKTQYWKKSFFSFLKHPEA